MLELQKMDQDSGYYGYVKELYDNSFPEDEKRDFNELISGSLYDSDLYVVLRKNRPVGMVCCLTYNDITHILYIAVDKRYRNKGYGGEILSLVNELYQGNRFVADLEEPLQDAADLENREKRIDFYLDNGYKFTDISYEWHGERYIILSRNGYVSREEFSAFWDHFGNDQP